MERKGRKRFGKAGPAPQAFLTEGRWPLLGFWKLPLSFEMCISLLVLRLHGQGRWAYEVSI